MNKPPHVMGIINITPDSFSGDGLLTHNDPVASALAQAQQMVNDGATLLDVGGESSRPGARPVDAEEEMNRVVPVILALKKGLSPPPIIAIDTVKAVVAEAALKAGATVVNDTSALNNDARMTEVVARYQAQIILMHNRAIPEAISRNTKIGNQYNAPAYDDVVTEVINDLALKVERAVKNGIAREKIILDPGIGFGKTPLQNLALIAQLHRIKALGLPVLIGVSRKSFIGHILDAPVDERLPGTAATVSVAVFNGADILRVHDVKFMVQVVKISAALRATSLGGKIDYDHQLA